MEIQEKRSYTNDEILDQGLILSEFKIPTDRTCSFTGTLVTRHWAKKASFRKSLVCYFVASDGSKYLLLAYQDLKTRVYKPRNTDIDFSEIKLGSTLKITYEITKTNFANWLSAELINK